MLFKIKLICPEVDGFLREYEIDSEATFLDLNKAILDSCHFPDDQMTSFYICSSDWERGMQITREDMSEEGDNAEDILEMAKTRLSEFIEDAGQNIEFVFDPFSDRSFYLAVRELIPGKNLKKARVVRSQGRAPPANQRPRLFNARGCRDSRRRSRRRHLRRHHRRLQRRRTRPRRLRNIRRRVLSAAPAAHPSPTSLLPKRRQVFLCVRSTRPNFSKQRFAKRCRCFRQNMYIFSPKHVHLFEKTCTSF